MDYCNSDKLGEFNVYHSNQIGNIKERHLSNKAFYYKCC